MYYEYLILTPKNICISLCDLKYFNMKKYFKFKIYYN